jgi:hypothetical protein
MKLFKPNKGTIVKSLFVQFFKKSLKKKSSSFEHKHTEFFIFFFNYLVKVFEHVKYSFADKKLFIELHEEVFNLYSASLKQKLFDENIFLWWLKGGKHFY